MALEHECIIGLYYDVDIDRLTTFRGLKYLSSYNEEIRRATNLDPVYAKIYYDHCNKYEFKDYFDKRKSVNMKRFEYCPMCGEKIDWKEMKKIAAVSD